MGNRLRIRRVHAFIGSPYDSVFMRWFFRCTWIIFALLFVAAGYLRAEDRPVTHLSDSVFSGTGTAVYAFVDPVTHRRFLVINTSNGVAMIEATPAPVAYVSPEPVVQRLPPPPPDTKSMWEVSRTYLFTQKMADAGWVITKRETVAGRELAHIRRKNPHWAEPDVEKPKE